MNKSKTFSLFLMTVILLYIIVNVDMNKDYTSARDRDQGYTNVSSSYYVRPSDGFESESGMACYTVLPVKNNTKDGTYKNLLKVINDPGDKTYGFNRDEIIGSLKNVWTEDGFKKFVLFYNALAYDSDYHSWENTRQNIYNFGTIMYKDAQTTSHNLSKINSSLPTHFPTFDSTIDIPSSHAIGVRYSFGAMAYGGSINEVIGRYNDLAVSSDIYKKLNDTKTYNRDEITIKGKKKKYRHHAKVRDYIKERFGIKSKEEFKENLLKSVKSEHRFLEMYHIYKFKHTGTNFKDNKFWKRDYVQTITTLELLIKWSNANRDYTYLTDVVKRFLFEESYNKLNNYIILWTPILGRVDIPTKSSHINARVLAHPMTYALAHPDLNKKIEAKLPDKMTTVVDMSETDNIWTILDLHTKNKKLRMDAFKIKTHQKKSVNMFAKPTYGPEKIVEVKINNKIKEFKVRDVTSWEKYNQSSPTQANHYMTFGLEGGYGGPITGTGKKEGVRFLQAFNTKHKDTGGKTLPFQTFDYIELGEGWIIDKKYKSISSNAKFYIIKGDELKEHSSRNSARHLLDYKYKNHDMYINKDDNVFYICSISLSEYKDFEGLEEFKIEINLYDKEDDYNYRNTLFNIKAPNKTELNIIKKEFRNRGILINIGGLDTLYSDAANSEIKLIINGRDNSSYKINKELLNKDIVTTIIIPLKIELKDNVDSGKLYGNLRATIDWKDNSIINSDIYTNAAALHEYEMIHRDRHGEQGIHDEGDGIDVYYRDEYKSVLSIFDRVIVRVDTIKSHVNMTNTELGINLSKLKRYGGEGVRLVDRSDNISIDNTKRFGLNQKHNFNIYTIPSYFAINENGINDYVKINPVESKNLFATDLKIKDVVISKEKPRYIDILWEFNGTALDKEKIKGMIDSTPTTGKTHLAKAIISVSQSKPRKNSKWNIDTNRTKIYPLDSTFNGDKITEDISKYYTDTISISNGDTPNKLLSGKVKVDKTNYESCNVLTKGDSNISYDKNGKIHFGTNYYAGDVWNDDIAFTLYSKTGDKYKTNYGKTTTNSEDIVNDLEDVSFKFITRLTPKGDWLKNETKKIGSASGDVLRKELEYNFVYKMKANMELKLFEYDPKVSAIDISTIHASNKFSKEPSILDKLLRVNTVKANDKIKDLIDDTIKEKDLNNLYKVKSKAGGKNPISHSVYDSISKKNIKVKEIKNIQGIYRKYNTSEKLKYKDEATITDNVGNGEESTVETRSYAGQGKFGVFTGVSYGKEGAEDILTPPPTFVEEPFEYHSTLEPRFYSELKANEPLNEDWNALEGVPSDERLFVASGGEKFQVDVSGITKKQDNITRRITFNVAVQKSWVNNPPNVLGNREHLIHTITVPTISVSEASYSCNRGKPPTASAKKVTATDGTVIGHPTITPVSTTCTESDGKGGIKSYSAYNRDGAGVSYSRTVKWYFNDETGVYRVEDSLGSPPTASGVAYIRNIPPTPQTPSPSTVLNKWGQSYIMEAPIRCVLGKIDEPSSVVVHKRDILSDGYTVGKGSIVTTNYTNMLNPTTENGNRTITEKIDRIIYLNIKDYAINGLYKNELSDANTDVFEDSANGNSAGNPLQALVYNIKDDGFYESMNGRLWFTKPVKDTWKEGGPGWKNTTVNEHYWLGDMVVNITVIPDNDYALKNDGKLHTDSIRDNAGAIEDKWRWEPTEVSQAAKDYFNGKNYIGDRTDKNGTLSKMINATINRWLKANESDKYTVHVVSDAMSIGTTSGNKYQDIVASVYPVDNGINIFKTPFSDGITNIDVEHKCRNINKAVLFDKGEYSMQTVFGEDEISVDGYNGVISSVYSDKYMGVRKVQDKETVKPIVQSLNNEGWLKEKFPDGMPYNLGSPEYTNTGETYGYNNPRFVAKSTLVETPNGNGVTYNGYYQDYDLGCAMGVNVSNVQFGEVRDTPEITDNSYTNSGAANIAKYDIPLVMTNLDLKDRDARNGSYISPITSKGYYGLMLSKYETSAKDSWDKRTLELTGKYTDNFINENNDEDKINSIIVHTPVSVEYSRIIPYKDQLVTDDHKDEYDLRVEKTINKYSLVGDFTEIFYSPIGDFHDPSGRDVGTHIRQPRGMGLKSKHVSCAKPSRYIVEGWDGYRKEPLSKAYTDQMDTTRWTDTTFLMTPYPYYYFNTAGEKVSVPPNVKVDLATFGDKSKRKATVISNDKSAGVPGYVLSIFVLTSANEMISGQVKLFSNAINKEDPKSENVANPENTNKERIGYNAFHDSRFIETVDVVGRLGNMSMSDTEDFRFSNLFRKPIDKWRIPNIIRDVDLNTPNMVVADSKNILCKPVPFGGMGHTTQGMTYFSDKEIEKNTKPWNRGIAKANENYISFPLTPAKNNVPELRNSPMRMGYAMFLDIETIGNYHSDSNDMNFKHQGIEISPYYMLYDLDKKEYIPIDIYYGNSINKEKLYSYGEKIPSPNYTYNINVAEEFGRRNITEVETKTTDEIMRPLMKFGTMKTYDIGTPSDIFLNGLSRNFIGSSVLESGIAMDNEVPKVVGETGITNYQNSYNNKNNWSWSYGTDKERLSEGEFQVQGQRWYWKLGLPSSAMIVPHGPIPTGSSVEKENQKLKNKRKNSIIVCTANIIAHGEVWKLQYNNKLMNNGEITVFEENNKKVKIPVPGIVEGVNHEKFAIINVYDAWETSASDKSVRGTH